MFILSASQGSHIRIHRHLHKIIHTKLTRGYLQGVAIGVNKIIKNLQGGIYKE